MFENENKFKIIKRIVICVTVFWITMFLTGMMISVNEHMEQGKDGRDKKPAVQYERVVEKVVENQ